MGIKINKPASVAPAVAPAPVKAPVFKKGVGAKSQLDSLMGVPDSFTGKELFDRAGDLKDQADLLMLDRASVLLELARATCPYKVGDKLTLNRGLGAGGLLVEEVMACEFPAFNNRWAIQTLGIAKDGSVSRRTLLLSEWQLSDPSHAGLQITQGKKVLK